MLRCKKTLATRGLTLYLANRSAASARCILGRFLPKLGGAESAAIFLSGAFCGDFLLGAALA
jgi:hypothetical protein